MERCMTFSGGKVTYYRFDGGDDGVEKDQLKRI